MPKSIYSIQERLDSILDIDTCYVTPDKELFDTTGYVYGDFQKGEHNTFYGKKHTKETIELMKKDGRKGRKHTAETKKLLSELAKERHKTGSLKPIPRDKWYQKQNS